jgi:hypothetical protein
MVQPKYTLNRQFYIPLAFDTVLRPRVSDLDMSNLDIRDWDFGVDLSGCFYRLELWINWAILKTYSRKSLRYQLSNIVIPRLKISYLCRMFGFTRAFVGIVVTFYKGRSSIGTFWVCVWVGCRIFTATATITLTANIDAIQVVFAGNVIRKKNIRVNYSIIFLQLNW